MTAVRKSMRREKPKTKTVRAAKAASRWKGKELTALSERVGFELDALEMEYHRACEEDDREGMARIAKAMDSAEAAYAVLNYSPHQPRDKNGRWTGSGAVAAKYGLKPAAEATPALDKDGKPRVNKHGDPVMVRKGEGSHTLDGRPIPPGWTDAYVSDNPATKVQAVGQDAKGRTVRIYSEKFSKEQGEAKFKRVTALERDQKSLFAKTAKDAVSKDHDTAEAASALRLVQVTGIRPGSTRDTKAAKQAYGATTLQGRHVVQNGSDVRLDFVGKKGVSLSIPVEDKAVRADVLARAKKAGPRGRLFDTTDGKMRGYSKTVSGGKYKPKDYRTLKGTTSARAMVADMPKAKNMKEYKASVMDVAGRVSTQLGNTPVVALQSYINPRVFAPIKP